MIFTELEMQFEPNISSILLKLIIINTIKAKIEIPI